jgi:hypothetical protein
MQMVIADDDLGNVAMKSEPQAKLWPIPESGRERLLYALIGIVLPAVCFSLSNILKPEWQSGEFSDYVNLMLTPQVAWFFFPFLVYSIVCFLLLLIAPGRFAPRFVVRFGIYTGVALALQYVVMLAGTGLIFISTVSAGILILLKWANGKVKLKWKVGYRITVLLAFILITTLILSHPSFQTESLTSLLNSLAAFFSGALFWALIAILAATPILCLIITSVTAIKLIKIYETQTFKLWQATTLTAWLVSYLFAWRFSILKAIEVYASLPTSPPNCYIATASARGHKRIVHSKMVVTTNGAVWITTQLQILKCAELALMALAPRFHYCLRAVYDVAGYTVAKRITNPFLADLAYLTLKPFEWVTTLALKAIVPEIDAYVGRLYSEK